MLKTKMPVRELVIWSILGNINSSVLEAHHSIWTPWCSKDDHMLKETEPTLWTTTWMGVRSASELQTLHSLFKPRLARLNSHSLVWSANRMSRTEMSKEHGNCLKQMWANILALEIGHRDSLVHLEVFNSTKTQPRQHMTKQSQGHQGLCALKERDRMVNHRQKKARYRTAIPKLAEEISAIVKS